MSDQIELATAWSEIITPSRRSAALFDDLIGRHRQAHRRYHCVRHVVWVVRHIRALVAEITECRDDMFDAGAVLAAAFFHDAIYDLERADNEDRSAMLAEHELAQIGWSERRAALVGELVRATAGHIDEIARSSAATDLEYGVLLDADLAVLGSDPESYRAYSSGVRAEYASVSDADWQIGRGAVLRHLLHRSALYETAPARTWWDKAARANLTAELAGLQTLSRGG